MGRLTRAIARLGQAPRQGLFTPRPDLLAAVRVRKKGPRASGGSWKSRFSRQIFVSRSSFLTPGHRKT